MMAFTSALGWALLSSIWQLGLLWLVFRTITLLYKRISASQSYALALVLLSAGYSWFLNGLFTGLTGKTAGIQGSSLLYTDAASSLMAGLKHRADLLMPYLSMVYLLVLAFFCIRYIREWAGLRGLRNDGQPGVQAPFQSFCDSFADKLGISRSVALRVSDKIDSPLTIGFLKPLILLPIACINQLSPDQVEAILLHELAHIKRNDYLVNLFVSFASAWFFFNPFARFFVQIIQREREHACDDVVMLWFNDPYRYASALLSLEKERQYFPFALNATGKGKYFLLMRVKRLLGLPEATSPKPRHWMGFTCLCIVLFLLFSLKPIAISKTVSATNGHKEQNNSTGLDGTGKPRHKKRVRTGLKNSPGKEVLDTATDETADPVWVNAGNNPGIQKNTTKNQASKMEVVVPAAGNVENDPLPGDKATTISAEYPGNSVKVYSIATEDNMSKTGVQQEVQEIYSLQPLYEELLQLKSVDWRNLDNDSLTHLYAGELKNLDSAWANITTHFTVQVKKINLTNPGSNLNLSVAYGSYQPDISPAALEFNPADGDNNSYESNSREILRRDWQKRYQVLIKKMKLLRKIMAPESKGKTIVYI